MTQHYTFSYYIKEQTPYIQKRKWWNLFGSDSLQFKDQWVRKVYTISDKRIADLLIASSGKWFLDDLGKIILGNSEVTQVQLEECASSTQYIS